MAEHKADGYYTFAHGMDEDGNSILICRGETLEEIINKAIRRSSGSMDSVYREMYTNQYTREVYDLFSGEEFLEMVLDKSIIDYDGSINNVYVDGRLSNLGLCAGDLESGNFLVDENTWRYLCKQFKIEVDWCNR